MTGETKGWAIALVLLITLGTTVAQYFLKTGTALFPLIFTNIPLLLGIVLYAIGSGALILAFKGGDVSVLYPIIATSYLWVGLMSFFFLGEQVQLLRWIGILVVIVGVTLIGFGSRSHAAGAV